MLTVCVLTYVLSLVLFGSSIHDCIHVYHSAIISMRLLNDRIGQHTCGDKKQSKGKRGDKTQSSDK